MVISLAALVACNQPVAHAEASYSQLHGESGIVSGKNYAKIVADLRATAQANAHLAEVIEYGKSGRGKLLVAMKVIDKNA